MLYYTDIDFKTRFDEEMESHTISSVQLPTMISNIEAKLGEEAVLHDQLNIHAFSFTGSSLSQWPRLTFVIYIPKDSQRPLHVKEGAGNLRIFSCHTIRRVKGESLDAFLVPQWGGVIFYNNVQRDGNTVRINMNETMPTIVRQLKLLLGLKEVHCMKEGFIFLFFLSTASRLQTFKLLHP